MNDDDTFNYIVESIILPSHRVEWGIDFEKFKKR